jgi:ABC-type multidrug transport system fused ATPase/permease subunit
MKYIYNIAKEYKHSLILIYVYMFVAQLLFLLEPYVLGKMIDGLIKKEYYWMYCFICIAAFENFFIYKRMVFDTKIYTKIYNDLILKYLNREKDADISAKIARTELSNHIINFLENDVHYYIMAVITVFGSLSFIFLENPLTGFVVLASIIPICLIVYSLYNKIAQGTRVAHTHYEQKVSILTEGDDNKIDTFFKRRRKVLIYQSTIQGKNWTALSLTKGIFLILSIVVFTHSSVDLSQGQAVSMYAYINQFLISLMSIPVGVEMFTRLKDIVNRIKE